jgi:hypothetical protein
LAVFFLTDELANRYVDGNTPRVNAKKVVQKKCRQTQKPSLRLHTSSQNAENQIKMQISLFFEKPIL